MKKEADEMAVKIRDAIAILEDAEEFTGMQTGPTRELLRMILSAYDGNPIDTQRILDLQAAQRHNRLKGAPHGKFRELRLVRSDLPSPDDIDSDWTIRPPGPI